MTTNPVVLQCQVLARSVVERLPDALGGAIAARLVSPDIAQRPTSVTTSDQCP